MKLSRSILYYGKAEEIPVVIDLQAGPLTLALEGGDLRAVRLGNQEIVRRLYVAVRDRNWGTVVPEYSDFVIEREPYSFRVRFSVQNRHGEIDFAWHGEIIGTPEGTITYRMEGAARSTFLKNRIGFCVLNPAGLAGAAFEIEHVDGSRKLAALPETISPDQPLRSFNDLRALTHQIYPGVRVEVRMEGDIFEMEDQRNWTDASFKTFSTPLRLPYPVEIQAGEQVVQSVTIKLLGSPAKSWSRDTARSAVNQNEPLQVIVDWDGPVHKIPFIGLGTASHDQRLTTTQLERLRKMNLAHLRVDLALNDPRWPLRLEMAANQCTRLGVGLHAALIFDPQDAEELRTVRERVHALSAPVTTWLIYPEREFFNGGSPVAKVVSLAWTFLKDAIPGARFAAGTNTDLIFLQRSPPPYNLLDAVCFAVNPQVHAFDNTSLVENLEGQMHAVRSAARLAGGLPVLVSPVTLKPRHNPYATGPSPAVPAGQLPPQVDPRQMALFGAAWTAGSIKAMNLGGAESVTYYETTGWRGVMELEQGPALPQAFPSLPGGVFPLYHPLADAGEFSGGQLVNVRSDQPQKVDAFVFRTAQRAALFVVNFTSEVQAVRLDALPGPASIRILDEYSARTAMLEPDQFRATFAPVKGDTPVIEMLPYSVARIDLDNR